MRILLVLATTCAIAGAAAPRIDWAPKSDRGFDQAMEQRKFVLQVFVKPKCAECALLERTVFKDPDVLEFLAEKFVAIRSDVAKPDGRTDAENYGVEDFPTVLFFNAKGEQVEGATLTGQLGADEFLQHLVNVASGKFGQAAAPALIPATGQATTATAPSSSGWSRPDTTATIAPPPLPDTAAPRAP